MHIAITITIIILIIIVIVIHLGYIQFTRYMYVCVHIHTGYTEIIALITIACLNTFGRFQKLHKNDYIRIYDSYYKKNKTGNDIFIVEHYKRFPSVSLSGMFCFYLTVNYGGYRHFVRSEAKSQDDWLLTLILKLHLFTEEEEIRFLTSQTSKTILSNIC